MPANSPPFIPGQSASAVFDNIYKANLGRKWVYEGSGWRLCKAAAALTAMGGATVISAETAGVPTYVANTTTTAGSFAVVGVCAPSQVDLAIGDYFLVQVDGMATVVSAAAIAVDVAVATSTTAKQVNVTGATLNAVVGYVKLAAGAGGVSIPCQLIAR